MEGIECPAKKKAQITHALQKLLDNKDKLLDDKDNGTWPTRTSTWPTRINSLRNARMKTTLSERIVSPKGDVRYKTAS